MYSVILERYVFIQVNDFSFQAKKKPAVLPGVNNWLRSSNEYGGQLFYVFASYALQMNKII